ncbi:NepR family anti-sigma factor [Methylobacterium isbiliense]|uniref:Anti-sigma factor NepR domain-containing protein n=1 Tax=Methylobacterium isbiliense TaxID=315478 RepID=A0ABQ4SF66_9HYPH|nr:NepR family anti-sigma factor [Methylobacterium isbiliense]MDN3625172.1 NepR family anti-sigma factor [Methylobacterium isbiliense]GJE00414.1 hypothetical protein GMJLKIPL_2336 [Methylobacterium isbiliense]
MTNEDPARAKPAPGAGRRRAAQAGFRRQQAGGVDEAVREHLGRALRLAYADLMEAPIPDRFVTLLAALDRDPPAPEEASR